MARRLHRVCVITHDARVDDAPTHGSLLRDAGGRGGGVVGPLLGRRERDDDSVDGRPTRYRGVASGFGYIQTKLPQFLGIFLFPAFFSAIGAANATFFTAIFPLVGLLAATFILKEVYGFVDTRSSRAEAPSEPRAPAWARAA